MLNNSIIIQEYNLVQIWKELKDINAEVIQKGYAEFIANHACIAVYVFLSVTT
nr:hypothetical protein Iba_chr03aCG15130 [Ipomoea batatas]GMC74797.1 hypothetical protein Iba_chr03cCG13460 [Ipomoea batatas]GMC76779.1 hypothetical protein Iba_chr03eCG4420 [Ipomoea batatas]